ncbi:MAG: HD domain-containing protein [Lachnospiraceae bacterium]|nr:HD domain-containing protein [Lachnospiraceae bacterium]
MEKKYFFGKKKNTETDETKRNSGSIVSDGPVSSVRSSEGRMQLLIPILACVIGVGLNIGGRIAAISGGAPVRLDTAGTVLVSILGGYVPGIAVALCTNLMEFFLEPAAVYYAAVNVLIALLSTWMSRRLKLDGFKHFIMYVLVLTLVSGGPGGLMSMHLQSLGSENYSNMVREYLMDRGIYGNYIWLPLNVLFDFVDKILTMVFVSAVLCLIPERSRSRFELTGWMQEPVYGNAEKELEEVKTHRFSLNTKIVTVLISFSMALALICTAISLILFRNYSIQQHEILAKGIAKMAASVVDGDSVEMYLNNGDQYESYAETERLLTSIRDNSADVEYIYVYKIVSDGCHVVFDLDTEEVEGSPLGTVIPFDTAFMPYVSGLLSGKPIEPIISDETYGWLLTAYEPVYDSGGECVCYAAADISMNDLTAYQGEFVFKLLSIFSGFLILILALGVWLAKYHLILPINSMSGVTEQFEYDDEYARKANIKKLAALDICTGDEVEVLYRALMDTTEESARFFEENKQKTEKLDALQSGLVMVLADMVENRDEATGSHVRKTAAYVGITARKMREMGYYKGQITDKFIKDCVNSAPLHDIGKICIPDAILNKPGKLTEKEFEIMKTHAPQGKKVIEQAIATLPDADYLNEAKNLAGYHHEKWNGSGYPEGLSGEDIPLSARIMAVADVFDALVSKRCYKDAFSYDDALGIIKKDSGTHFDPLVADAFLNAKEEVLEVADSFAGQYFSGSDGK